jgi:Na+-translocating ferredoxin:NAD+ oxidoreductase subunit B
VGGASAEAVLALLPQTQCRRCGYDDCRGYAEAIAGAGAAINRCPPGGAEGVDRLARLTGMPALPLDPGCGTEGPRALALIDEAWCIGCALCLKACPVDAIVGAAKRMHVVIDELCTGCELCVPVCPVDCIAMIGASGDRTGWEAWDAARSAPRHERGRDAGHSGRLARAPGDHRRRPRPRPRGTRVAVTRTTDATPHRNDAR